MKEQKFVAVIKVRLTKETVEAYNGDFARIRERAEKYINNPRYYPDLKEKEGKKNNG